MDRHEDEFGLTARGPGGQLRGGATGQTLRTERTILYLNAQSIVGKIDELVCMANDTEPDVILITESWCNVDTNDAFLSTPGYNLQIRMDREDTAQGRGGGLLIYSKEGIDVLSTDNDLLPHQCCRFAVEDVTFYLVYRSPSAPAESITNLAELISSAGKNSVFIGDFNMPEIDWRGETARGRTQEFLEVTRDSLMTQLVTFSTHNKGNILDLVITNIPERITEVYEGGRLGRSDHSAIVCRVNIKQGLEKDHTAQLDWRRADWSKMREDLKRVQ